MKFTHLALLSTLFTPAAFAAPLTIDTYNPQEKGIFAVSSTLVSGPKEAVLFDAQFSVKDGEAQVRIGGQPLTLRLGESPVSVTGSALPSSNTGRIVLMANPQGHFLTPGMINGKSTRFLVDTGATTVSMGMSVARPFCRKT